MLAEQRASTLSGDIALRDLNLRDNVDYQALSTDVDGSHWTEGAEESAREPFEQVACCLPGSSLHQQIIDVATMPFNRPVTSQRSRGTMRDALRSPAHRRAPEPETYSVSAPPAAITLRKSATPTPSPTLQVVRSLPSQRRGFAPLEKKMLPLPRPCSKLDTDLFAHTESVSARRLLELRPLPAPVKNDIAPLATTCQQGSATREPVVRPGSTAPGPIDLSPAAHMHAGSDARAGAVDRFRRMPERYTGLEKEKRELLLLFASGRDTGFILDVTDGNIASPTGVARTPFRWPVPRAETTQGHPAAPLQVSAHRRFTIDGGSSKHLKKVEGAERAERDEERLVEALSEKALVKERTHGLSTEPVPVSAYVGSSKNLQDLQAARLEEDKRDLLSLFASGRDAGFILDVSGSSPAPVREIRRIINFG